MRLYQGTPLTPRAMVAVPRRVDARLRSVP
jgi:hypothetical protein